MVGHPLQYLQEYNRWVELAANQGKKLVILAPVYRSYRSITGVEMCTNS